MVGTITRDVVGTFCRECVFHFPHKSQAFVRYTACRTRAPFLDSQNYLDPDYCVSSVPTWHDTHLGCKPMHDMHVFAAFQRVHMKRAPTRASSDHARYSTLPQALSLASSNLYSFLTHSRITPMLTTSTGENVHGVARDLWSRHSSSACDVLHCVLPFQV